MTTTRTNENRGARWAWMVLALTALLAFGAALPVRAQQGDVDPPGRVARLSEVSGQVWLYSPDANEWLAVERNRPLTTGDRIATDNGARAEVTLGSTTLRLDSATELEIAVLDDSRFFLQLTSGSVSARLRNAQSVAEFALDTDEGRFRAQAVGRYRFDRFEQSSDLTVEAGQAVFEGRNSALPLTTGQHAQFWLDASGAAQYNMVEPARDDFAAWNAERDRAESRPVAATRFVSPEMTGAEDLDRYGSWEQTPEYGPIWTPRNVAVDWVPYSAGHWAWVRPWGWTWVDDAPWGFAPFHYGRWVHHRNAWGWAPGTYVARPVYAPALVAWIGGPRVGVSISIGGGGPPVGWFPLAPREVYVPSYRHSPRYVRDINVTHVTNVTQITTVVNNVRGGSDRRDFANRKFPHAVTVVPANVLTSRQSVAPVAAQYRANPQIRALLAEPRPAPVMLAPPVATPPAAPVRRAEDRAAIRPPFQGRTPGSFAGRPDRGATPAPAQPGGGVAPGGRPGGQAGGPPGNQSGPGAVGAAPRSVPMPGTGRPEATPRPGGHDMARPETQRPDGRPGVAGRPQAGDGALERPPVRGRIQREPGGDAPIPAPAAPQAVQPPAPAPQPVQTPAPGRAAPPAVVPPPPNAEAGRGGLDRVRPGRGGEREPSRGPDRSAAPPANIAPRAEPAMPRPVEPRAAESPRPGPPGLRGNEVRPIEAQRPPAAAPRAVEAQRPPQAAPRAIEAPRPQEAPRQVAPPSQQRAPEPARVAAPPVVVPGPRPEVARPEPQRGPPEKRVGRPETPRRDDKRDENEKTR